jgi:hypothetical protein
MTEGYKIGNDTFVELIKNGIPKGAEIYMVNADWGTRNIDIVFKHESFDDLLPGQPIPCQTPVFQTTVKDA